MSEKMFSEEQLEQLRSFPEITRDELIKYFTRMLLVDVSLRMTRLEWLNSPARDASASAVKTSIEKLTWFRNIDAHLLDLSMLPNERRRFLAQVARRSTNQGLERRGERRFPILLAFVAQAAVDQLDEVVALFDQAVSARESRAKSKTDAALAERAKKGEAGQLLMDVILPVLADASISDEQVGGILRDRVGMQMLRELNADAWTPLPKDHGRLSELDSSCTYLRQFTPNVLATIDFRGGPGTDALMRAVAILEEMNASGGRKVPSDAPTAFVPARYADYLDKARKSGQDTAYRHYWELCVILCLRDGLRSGDVWVPGSRRYAAPATYLYTPAQWAHRRDDYCRLVAKPTSAAEALEQGKEELHAALEELEGTLATRRRTTPARSVRTTMTTWWCRRCRPRTSQPRPRRSTTSWPGCRCRVGRSASRCGGFGGGSWP